METTNPSQIATDGSQAHRPRDDVFLNNEVRTWDSHYTVIASTAGDAPVHQAVR